MTQPAATLTRRERAILTPLLEESKTLHPGAEQHPVVASLAARGYVRFAPTLCMGMKTGETQIVITEAGRFVLLATAAQ